MRILFLSKRCPQQRDLVDRPYGRFFHLPTELAKKSHQVSVALFGHQGAEDVDTEREGVRWLARDLRGDGLWRSAREVLYVARSLRPDWVVACSDAWVACLASWVAKRAGSRLMVDAYDDFESYMPWNVPLHIAWRKVVARADLVTAAGPQLARHLQRHRRRGREVEVLPMAADPGFVPMDRDDCRQALGLPAGVPLLGYSGSWAANRGTDLILPVLREVRRRHPDTLLVLTGRPPAAVLGLPGVHSLGYLGDGLLPSAVNAVDVSCIVTADTRFGRNSYPAKLCEAMACRIPVVATGTGPVKWMLENHPAQVVPLGDVGAFAHAVSSNLGGARIAYGALPTWPGVAARLEYLLAC